MDRPLLSVSKNLPPGGRWPSEARSEEEFGQKSESQYYLKTF